MRNNPEESIRNLSRAMRIQQYKTDAKSGIETQNFARNRSEIVQKSFRNRSEINPHPSPQNSKWTPSIKTTKKNHWERSEIDSTRRDPDLSGGNYFLKKLKIRRNPGAVSYSGGRMHRYFFLSDCYFLSTEWIQMNGDHLNDSKQLWTRKDIGGGGGGSGGGGGGGGGKRQFPFVSELLEKSWPTHGYETSVFIYIYIYIYI